MGCGEAASRGRLAGRLAVGMEGVSHIEVLVAMLIIGLATPFLMGGIMGSLTQAGRSYERSAATVWIQGEIDHLRRQCYDRLSPSTRKVTPSTRQPGEPPLPDGFATASIRLEAAGTANLKVTVALYRKDWTGASPAEPAVLESTTYIGDLRVAGSCP